MVVQWNPSIVDTIGNQHFFPYSEVSLTQGIPLYLVCCIEHNVAMFQSFLVKYEDCRVAGCLLFRGCTNIDVNVRTIIIVESHVCYYCEFSLWGVSVKQRSTSLFHLIGIHPVLVTFYSYPKSRTTVFIPFCRRTFMWTSALEEKTVVCTVVDYGLIQWQGV